MVVLYRGHPTKDFLETDEKRGLSCTLHKDLAVLYAKNCLTNGSPEAYVSTIEFHGEITEIDQIFRGPDSFKDIVAHYSKARFDAVKTKDDKLVVVLNLSKLGSSTDEQVKPET